MPLAERAALAIENAETYQELQKSMERLQQAQKEVVRANRLEACYIRPIAFYGSEAMGISAKGVAVHVAIAAWPWGAYLGAEALDQGIRVKTSSYMRHHVNVTMCRAKANGNYINSMLALNEALASGCDEALLLDNDRVLRPYARSPSTPVLWRPSCGRSNRIRQSV